MNIFILKGRGVKSCDLLSNIKQLKLAIDKNKEMLYTINAMFNRKKTRREKC